MAMRALAWKPPSSRRSARGPRRGAEGSRLSRGRPDRARRRDPLRGARVGGRVADRVDGHAGGRQLPARATRRRGAIRVRGRAAFLEAVSVPALRSALAARPRSDGGFEVAEETPPRTGRLRSSACARASCTRWRFRIACSSAASTSTATTPGVERTPSSSRSTASSPRRRVSAPRWAPGRRLSLATTSRSPRSSTASIAFSREAGSERGAEILGELPRRPASETDATAAESSVAGADREDGQAGRRPRHPRPARRHAGAPALGRRRRALPDLRQLHARVPDVLLLECRGRHRLGGRRIRTLPQLGQLLLRHALAHPRRRDPASGRSRYRQWLTHKFGTWHDQFGSSGCVGCGRCIAWCPVGIDVTEELSALRTQEVTTDGNN